MAVSTYAVYSSRLSCGLLVRSLHACKMASAHASQQFAPCRCRIGAASVDPRYFSSGNSPVFRASYSVVVRFLSKTVSVILLGAAFASCCHLFLAAPVFAATIPSGCHNHGNPHAPMSHQCCSSANHSPSIVVTYNFFQALHRLDVITQPDEHLSHQRLSLVLFSSTSPPSTTPLRI